MKGVNFITNEKIAVQIDLKAIEKHHEAVENLLDGIIAEARKNEKKDSLIKSCKQFKKCR
ncbi:MAG TPA: hypothetical protein VJI69_05945 [Bacteroidia bacterium]|nr:hypothetical protein [Bacteroidia bacterium]